MMRAVIAVDIRPGPSANVVLVGGSGRCWSTRGARARHPLARTRAFLAEHGLAASDLAWVALTHFHVDHAGGAGRARRPGRRARDRGGAGQRARPARRRSVARLRGPAVPGRARAARRRRVEGLEVVHTPGQTPGHVTYWHAGERVAITGDLLQNGDVAWVPFGGPWAEGALETMIASVERIAALEPGMTIPGHGAAGRPTCRPRSPRTSSATSASARSRRARSGTRSAARSSRT